MYICATVVFYKNEHVDSVCITWWECNVKMLTEKKAALFENVQHYSLARYFLVCVTKYLKFSLCHVFFMTDHD